MSLPNRSRYKLSLDGVKELSIYHIVSDNTFSVVCIFFSTINLIYMIGTKSLNFRPIMEIWLYLAHLLFRVSDTDSDMSVHPSNPATPYLNSNRPCLLVYFKQMISKPSNVLEPNCIHTVLLQLIYQRYHTKYHTGNTLTSVSEKKCLVPCLCSFW